MKADGQELAGFRHVYTPTTRFGELRLSARDQPPTFWVSASGFITPRLLRADFEYAEAFGRGHVEGWAYVVDIRRVRLVHPWNLVLLSRLRGLPNLNRWIVVTDSAALRIGFSLLPHAWRPDEIVDDPEAALNSLHQSIFEQRSNKTPAPR